MAVFSRDGQTEYRAHPVVEEGLRRGQSRNTAGYERDTLYDDHGKLQTQSESRAVDSYELQQAVFDDPFYDPPAPTEEREVESRELSPEMKEFADFAGRILAVAIIRIVEDRVVPGVRSVWRKGRAAVGARLDKRRVRAAERDGVETADIEVAEPVVALTAQQFREATLLVTRVKEWANMRSRDLQRVVIVDDDLPPELREAINLILDDRMSDLDDDTLAMVRAYFSVTAVLTTDQLTKNPTEVEA
ncbi:MAG: hypothetical protein QM628_15705 [Propionicimonas sp.]